MERAFSLLQTKAISEGQDNVTVEGMASTPTADRHNDIVEPMGARFKTPMPLLWQHNHDQPVGNVDFAQPTKKGIPFKASLPVIKEAGRLQDRVNEAIHSLKYELVKAVSIGFQPLEDDYELLDNGGIRFKTWDWLELSLVTIPANSEAVISAVKSADDRALAALGRDSADRLAQVRMQHSSGGTERRRKVIFL
jgi:HK97 family phage prohead protease